MLTSYSTPTSLSGGPYPLGNFEGRECNASCRLLVDSEHRPKWKGLGRAGAPPPVSHVNVSSGWWCRHKGDKTIRIYNYMTSHLCGSCQGQWQKNRYCTLFTSSPNTQTQTNLYSNSNSFPLHSIFCLLHKPLSLSHPVLPPGSSYTTYGSPLKLRSLSTVFPITSLPSSDSSAARIDRRGNRPSRCSLYREP